MFGLRCAKLTIIAAVSVAGSAPAGAQLVQKLNPPEVAKPAGFYSHVAVVPPGTKLLYLAGQIGNRPDGTLAAGVENQLIQAFENVRAILASQGAGPEHIVKTTIYVSAPPTDWPRLRKHRQDFFKGTQPPPSTWIQVTAMSRPEYLVEVEAIAALPSR